MTERLYKFAKQVVDMFDKMQDTLKKNPDDSLARDFRRVEVWLTGSLYGLREEVRRLELESLRTAVASAGEPAVGGTEPASELTESVAMAMVQELQSTYDDATEKLKAIVLKYSGESA